MSSAHEDNFCSFPSACLYFSHLFALLECPVKCWSCENRHPSLGFNPWEKHSVKYGIIYGLPVDALYQVEEITLYFCFLRVFIVNGCRFCQMSFLCLLTWLSFPFILLMWYTAMILIRGWFCSRGTFANGWRHLWLSDWGWGRGGYWHHVQRLRILLYIVQCIKKNYLAQNVNSAEVEKPRTIDRKKSTLTDFWQLNQICIPGINTTGLCRAILSGCCYLPKDFYISVH